MPKTPASRAAAPVAPDHHAEPAAPVAQEKAEPVERRTYAPERRCDKCGSIRSVLLKTLPDSDGRVAYRRCKACLHKFWCYERTAR